MSYTRDDLKNTVNRSDLKGETLRIVSGMGETAEDGSWAGGFILARSNGTFAVLEGWTGPEGWLDDPLCGYDLRIALTLDEAWVMMNDEWTFEVLAPEKCAEPTLRERTEFDAELDRTRDEPGTRTR